MRIRRVDDQGDMRFGHAQGDYWFNAPEGVGLLVADRLMLFQGEWFADASQGTPWAAEVLGERTRDTRDLIVRTQVLNTNGVSDIDSYGSAFDPNTREWAADMTINTIYGAVAVSAPRLPGSVPPLSAPAIPDRLFPATELGVLGGTPQTMEPADLTVGPRADIRSFRITRMAAGSW
jgi:hypothetical protein